MLCRTITLPLFSILLAVALIAMARAEARVQPGSRCFTETGYCIEGRIREFWEQNGGLPVFGFPITKAAEETSQTDGRIYATVWTERERLEFHPELAGTPYEILMGLLGAEDLRVRGYLP